MPDLLHKHLGEGEIANEHIQALVLLVEEVPHPPRNNSTCCIHDVGVSTNKNVIIMGRSLIQGSEQIPN